LTNALTEISRDFERQTGISVRLNLAGSSTLRLQIEKGAACDVFFPADVKSVSDLARNRPQIFSRARAILTNRLVVVAGLHARGISNLTELAATSGWIALADPLTVPSGIYAKQALLSAGIWDAVQSRISPAMDVRAALAQVENNAAAYAIVYRTDVVSARDARMVLLIPGNLHQPIVYTLVMLAKAPHPMEAQAFWDYLLIPKSQAVFENYGFIVQGEGVYGF